MLLSQKLSHISHCYMLQEKTVRDSKKIILLQHILILKITHNL